MTIEFLGKTLLTFAQLHFVLQGQICLLLQGFPGSSEVKSSACNEADLGSIPGLGRWGDKESDTTEQLTPFADQLYVG